MRDSIDSKGRYASRIKFVHNVLAMRDDCGQTNMQLVGNLLAGIVIGGIPAIIADKASQNNCYADLRVIRLG